MRCPDWSSLVAHRYHADAEEPAGWWEAVSHLKSCERCRREALLADPTLLFVDQLPVEPAAERPFGSREVLALAGRRPEGTRTLSRSWLAAAAALVLALGLAQGARRLVPAQAESAPQSTATALDQAVEERVALEMPLVDGIENSDSRIYQVAAGEMDFVLIVDEGLELTDESLDL